MKIFRDYFSFSASERRGIILLLVLIILTTSLPVVWDLFIPQKSDLEIDSAYINDIRLFESQLQSSVPQLADRNPKEPKPPLKLQRFNPNTVSLDQLLAMGVDSKLAYNMVRFTSKGGKYYKNSDLKKLYTMDDSSFLQLEPYIVIESKYENKKGELFKEHFTQKTIQNVNINVADTTMLVALPGIGPATARRILKYRDMLGGFYSPEQFYEVYYLDSATIASFIKYIIIDTAAIKRVDLNSISYEALNAHPYISPYEAKAILSLRKALGKIKRSDELVKNKVLGIEKYRKFEHYIQLTN